jgi:hypothetical protein
MKYDLPGAIRVETDGPVLLVDGVELLGTGEPHDAPRKIAALPRQAVEATKRVLNLHVERAVLATIDFAMTAESESFDTPELRGNLDRFLGRS